MNGNAEILNYIHQNSEMGKATTKQLIGIVKGEGLKGYLQSQYNEYSCIFDTSEAYLKELNKDAKDLNAFSKAATYMMINIKTLTDKTESHIAEMLIQGSTMGITEITKKLKEYNNADPKILDLGHKLLKFEQQNIEELKLFL
ncbi:MAG: hypothetical protein H7X86_08610 [Gorillibacterium sp.]|nr:hypothetical protein [Gorillibacterium sp.]